MAASRSRRRGRGRKFDRVARDRDFENLSRYFARSPFAARRFTGRGGTPEPIQKDHFKNDAERELLLADSVGIALLVILETLKPAERLAFVLHDSFGVSFDEIAPIIGRTPVAARQLASRARRRVRGQNTIKNSNQIRQREIVEAFYAAARNGDFDRLLALLDPEVVLTADREALPAGAPTVIRGASKVAGQALKARRDKFAETAIVNGKAAIIVAAPAGRLRRALLFTIARRKIIRIEVVANRDKLRRLRVAQYFERKIIREK